MERSVSERSLCSASTGATFRSDDDYDWDANSERSSIGPVSHLPRCLQSSQRTWSFFCSDWKSLFWKQRPVTVLLWVNTLVCTAVICSEILIFETSTHELRRYRHRTAVFPLYVPHAVALAAACKWEGSVACANFLGLLAGRLYIAGRGGYDIVDEKVLYFVIVSVFGMLEVQVAAHFLRVKLCRSLKLVPVIDTVRDALWYFGIVFFISLTFETLMSLVSCATGLMAWSHFPRFWSTWWFAVLAALLTISPALIHILDYRPCYATILRPSKVLEFILLLACTVCVLGLIIFSEPLTTIIRPLPYLLYPLLIFSVFRFNRLGWAVVVACISYFCSWGSLHYQSSALYIISGSSDRSSPRLVLQLELFMSILGVVTISLAAAVRETKQLTIDLHKMNKKLEDAVRKRTQELMKANNELEVSQANAEKANHAKSDFLANMSHEIRTPIHGILGLADLLRQSELSPDQLESVASVKDCAELLLHIINSILDLAKIEAGRLEVECVPFETRDIVRTTLRMLQDRAKERGILLLWKVDADVPPLVAGDPGKLQQCLFNLVGNALKFTHQGSVIVSVRLFSPSYQPAESQTTTLQSKILGEPSKKLSSFSRLRSWASWPSSDIRVDFDEEIGKVIELQHKTYLQDAYPFSMEKIDTPMILGRDTRSQKSGLMDTEKRILFEVRDTGIGISKEIRQDMFNPFTQADASTSRLYGGTGLGLCIVQRFVELLKGKIWVESEIGEGSIFCFVIPFQPLLADERLAASQRLYQSSHEVLEPSLKTVNLTFPRIHQRAAGYHSSQGRRVQSWRSLDSSSFTDRVRDDQDEPSIYKQSAELVDTKKRTMEDKKQLGLCMRKNDLRCADRDPKLQKGAGNPKFSNSRNVTGEGLLREQSHMCVVSACNCGIDVVELLHSSEAGKEGEDAGREGDLSSLKSNLHGTSNLDRGGTSNLDRVGWDVEQGLLETINSKRYFAEHLVHSCDGNESHSLHAVEPHKLGSAPNVDSLSRVESQEMFSLVPRKENLHILLAEDNLINQKVASRQLMRHGYTVTIVGDGIQALETLRRDHQKFDLVLMDIQMPNLDGLRATSIFREEEAIQGWRRLPVLGLTAHAISGYQDTCLSHGMDAYLDGRYSESNGSPRQRNDEWMDAIRIRELIGLANSQMIVQNTLDAGPATSSPSHLETHSAGDNRTGQCQPLQALTKEEGPERRNKAPRLLSQCGGTKPFTLILIVGI